MSDQLALIDDGTPAIECSAVISVPTKYAAGAADA